MRTTFRWVTWRASSSSRLKRRLDLQRALRIGERLGQDDLQRDRDAELLVPRLVDRAHAAGAQGLEDAVARAELLAGRERAGASAGRGRASRAARQRPWSWHLPARPAQHGRRVRRRLAVAGVEIRTRGQRPFCGGRSLPHSGQTMCRKGRRTRLRIGRAIIARSP